MIRQTAGCGEEVTPFRIGAFSNFLLSPPMTYVLTVQGAQRRSFSRTVAICLHNSRVGRIMANRPELQCILVPRLLLSTSWMSDMIRCTMGKRYARVFPKPVSV